jgi:capsular polysaccharide biosynthesis protein
MGDLRMYQYVSVCITATCSDSFVCRDSRGPREHRCSRKVGFLSEEQLDVMGSLRLVRDHWRTCFLVVLLGITASTAYLFLRAPLFTSTALVLLPGSLSANPAQPASSNDMTTAALIATSAGVLTPAGRELKPPLSFTTLKQRVSAAGAATNVLRITADAPSGSDAEALANAVANKLVAFETATGSVTDQSALAGLRANAAQLSRQINNYTGEISAANARLNVEGASSNAGRQDSGLIASLTTDQNQASLQLDTVDSEISDAKLGALASGQGTEVIQHADVAVPPSIFHKFFVEILGMLGGVFVGAVLVLVRHRRDRRLHRRDEIADVIGVPVLISLAAPSRRRSVSGWIDLLERYLPTAAEDWGVRQALRHVELRGTPAHLTVLVFAGDTAGLAAAPQMAVVLSTLGVPTDFVLGPRHEFASRLRSACDRLSRGTGPRVNFRVWNEGPPEDTEAPALNVRCIVVDPARPKVPSIPHNGSTLLAVSAGFGTAEQFARLAIAAADAGSPLSGIVLVNPEVDDRTTGRFPQIAPRAATALQPLTKATRRLAR